MYSVRSKSFLNLAFRSIIVFSILFTSLATQTAWAIYEMAKNDQETTLSLQKNQAVFPHNKIKNFISFVKNELFYRESKDDIGKEFKAPSQSTTNPSSIWVGTNNNVQAAHSPDSGITFITGNLSSIGYIISAAAVSGNAQTAYYLTRLDSPLSIKLWETTNGGSLYTPVVEFTNLINDTRGYKVTDIFTNPQDPDEIFAIWGRNPVNSPDSEQIGGIFRCLRQESGNFTCNKREFPYLVKNTGKGLINSNNTIIAIVEQGRANPSYGGDFNYVVWRSTDKGNTWNRVWYTQRDPNGAFGSAYGLTYSWRNPEIWYASLVGSEPKYFNGIIKSTNDGVSWSYIDIFPFDPTDPAHVNNYKKVTDLAVDSFDPNRVVFIADTNSSEDEGIYVSTDGLATWTKTKALSEPSVNDGWRIKADPSIGGRFWLIGNLGNGNGLYRSDTGGDTWELVSNTPSLGSMNKKAVALDISKPEISSSRNSNLSNSTPKNGAADPRECPINGCAGQQISVGDPVNTQTGVFDYSYVDLSMPTMAGPLSFQRTYVSSAQDEYGNPLYNSTLGYGWTHNHDIRLILPTSTSFPREVWFKATTANQYRFTETSAGVFQPDPGVLATMTVDGDGKYILIDSAKNTYTFESNGQVLAWSNYAGYGFNYQYKDGLLHKVSASEGGKSLTFEYSTAGSEITTTVSDQSKRSVSFVNSAGTLTVATDVMGQSWNYDYNQFKQLTTIQDPRGVTVLRNVYDDYLRVKEQYDGNGTKTLDLNYDNNNQTTILDANQNATIHTYNDQQELISQTDALNQITSVERDPNNHRPNKIVNPASKEANMGWSLDGANLLTFNDAEGNLTVREYDDLNNLTKVIAPESQETTYTYEGKLMTSSQNALGQITTYTYTTAEDAPQPIGLLKTVTDPMGKTTRYEYDAYGNRIKVIDSLNLTTQYEYDSLGRLISTTSPEGLITTNEYDLAGRIVRTTRNHIENYPQNHEDMYNIVTEYGYDPAGNQIAATNTLGYTTFYTYDNNNRLLTTTDALGYTSTNVYNAMGRLESSTDALGNATTYSYDEIGRPKTSADPLQNTMESFYDVVENKTTLRDARGYDTVFYYDGMNRVIRVVDAMGNQTFTTYDGNGRVLTKTDALGRVTRNEYDPVGRLATQTVNYDPNRPLNDLGQYNLMTQYFYDARGNTTETVDPMGFISKSEYDEHGRLLRSIRNYDPTQSQNYLNQYNIVTTYEYDSLGRQNKTTDTYGHISFSEYDPIGRLATKTINYDPNLAQNYLNQYNLLTTYEYDSLGRQNKTTDTYGNVSFSEYDSVGRLATKTVNYDPNPPLNDENVYNIKTAYEYDAAGRQVQVIDPDERITKNEYDDAGRLFRQIKNYDPNRQENELNEYNIITEYHYDENGNKVEEIDPNDRVTRNEYDELNRITATIYNYIEGATPSPDVNVRVEYAYNEVGNRISVKDANGNETLYTYDALNRVIREETPMGKITQYEYDPRGNLIQKTNPDGSSIHYQYDALNRLILEDYPSPEADHSFQYDALGRLTAMTDGIGQTTWQYDALGRVTAIQDPYSTLIEYSYDALGNLLSISSPGQLTSYGYDSLNRMITATDSVGGQTTTFAYAATGKLLRVTRPNGVASQYTYNQLGRVTSIENSGLNGTLSSFSYGYDPAGNLISSSEMILEATGTDPTPTPTLTATVTRTPTITPTRTATPVRTPRITRTLTTPNPTPACTPCAKQPCPDNACTPIYSSMQENSMALTTEGDLTITYSYDGLNRMTQAIYSNGTYFTYAYDANGNTTQLNKMVDGSSVESIAQYTYNADNQLTAAAYPLNMTTWNYSYNDNGNLVEVTPSGSNQTGAARYSYNTANLLTQVAQHNGTAYQITATMEYNGLGERLEMTSNTLVSIYTVDLLNGGRVVSATTAGLTTRYLYARGPMAEYSNGGLSYYLTDRANLVRQVTDGDGEALFAVRYSPWGEVLWQSGADSLAWGYLGGWSDAATGLVYVGNGQYYDPATGRFLTRQGRSGSANPYLPDLTSAILGPLSLAALFVQSRKDRRGKAGRWVAFILLTLTVVALGAACNCQAQPGTQTSTPNNYATIIPSPTTVFTSTPIATTPTFTITPTPINTSQLYLGNKAAEWAFEHFSDSEIIVGNDCTNFVSRALREGNIIEDQPNNWYPTSPGINDPDPWNRAPDLYKYLTRSKANGGLGYPSISARNELQGSWSDNSAYGPIRGKSEWENLLKNNVGRIQPGDVVFYLDHSISSDYTHAAIIYDTGQNETCDSQYKIPEAITRLDGVKPEVPCDVSRKKPRVVEHSGPGMILPRSIDDTNNVYISEIAIVLMSAR